MSLNCVAEASPDGAMSLAYHRTFGATLIDSEFVDDLDEDDSLPPRLAVQGDILEFSCAH